MRFQLFRLRPVLGSLLAGLLLAPDVLAQPQPPAQPATGPGGTDYAHGSLTVSGPFWAAGHGSDNAFRYYIFEPSAPTPASAPVVLFLHGWLAYNPSEYGMWMAHMVRKGYTVVWAQYDGGLIDTWNWGNNTATTWIDALDRLRTQPGRVRPENDAQGKPKTAIVGHSAGGLLGAVLAAKATRWWWWRLPKPNAIFMVAPGITGLIPGEDYSRIGADTKILTVVGEADTIVCASNAQTIWNQLTIGDSNKDFLVLPSDSYGWPHQEANHFYPTSTGTWDTAAIDGRDYWVTYRLSVALLNCAFKGTDCNIALGNGSLEQVDAGAWSDGTVRLPLRWIENPSSLSLGCE